MSTKKTLLYILFLSIISLVMTSCYRDREELLYPKPKFDCSVKQSTYSGDIQSIFSSKCLSCHSTSGTASGYPLSNYTDLINANTVDTSLIRSDCLDGGNPMPKVGYPQLTEVEKSKLRCWLDNGAQNN